MSVANNSKRRNKRGASASEERPAVVSARLRAIGFLYSEGILIWRDDRDRPATHEQMAWALDYLNRGHGRWPARLLDDVAPPPIILDVPRLEAIEAEARDGLGPDVHIMDLGREVIARVRTVTHGLDPSAARGLRDLLRGLAKHQYVPQDRIPDSAPRIDGDTPLPAPRRSETPTLDSGLVYGQICRHCGARFETRSETARACSPACRQALYRAKRDARADLS